MYVYDKKENCSGCTACQHSCPTGAITMVPDEEGFNYPFIQETKCIDCGLCRAVCPFQERVMKDNGGIAPVVYACKNKDEKARITSSSGGFYPALAELIISKGGVVYGAAFDENFRVEHQKAESIDEAQKFKGSKYVQSDLGDIFVKVRQDLEADKHVLFTGTPCQVAGLTAFLRKDYEKLVLIDNVCLGTPSPLVWEQYIRLLAQRGRSPIVHFAFRHKKLGWHGSRLHVKFKNGTELMNDPFLDSFKGIFYTHTALRPSCHICVFAHLTRPGDITAGDFWGIEKHKPKFDDDKGVSLVLLT